MKSCILSPLHKTLWYRDRSYLERHLVVVKYKWTQNVLSRAGPQYWKIDSLLKNKASEAGGPPFSVWIFLLHLVYDSVQCVGCKNIVNFNVNIESTIYKPHKYFYKHFYKYFTNLSYIYKNRKSATVGPCLGKMCKLTVLRMCKLTPLHQMCKSANWHHTSYLSFFLHWQNFWKIKFTPKNANFSR